MVRICLLTILFSACSAPAMHNIQTLLNKQLREAARNGHETRAKALIAFGANVNSYDKNGNSPLHCAVRHSSMVALLLDRGANVHARNKNFETPLLCWPCPKASITLLLDAHADINAQDKDGDTALHHAVLYSCKKEVALLLKRKADPNITTKEGQTPLFLATDGSTIEKLLACGVNANAQDADGNTPLHQACRGKSLSLIKAFVYKSDPNIQNKEGKTPLHIAAAALPSNSKLSFYSPSKVRWFLLHNPLTQINIKDNRKRVPILELVCNDSAASESDIVCKMIEKGANIFARDVNDVCAYDVMRKSEKYALLRSTIRSMIAYAYGTAFLALHHYKRLPVEIVRAIFDYLPGELEYYAYSCHKPASVPCPFGCPGNLHWRYDELACHRIAGASIYDHILNKRSDAGTIFNTKIKQLKSAVDLYYATRRNNMDVIPGLIKNSADVVHKDEYGWTPLHWAAYLGYADVLNLLLGTYGFRTLCDEKTAHGDTPLILALRGPTSCEQRELTALTLLLRGANPFATNYAGQSAYSLALHDRKGRLDDLLLCFE